MFSSYCEFLRFFCSKPFWPVLCCPKEILVEDSDFIDDEESEGEDENEDGGAVPVEGLRHLMNSSSMLRLRNVFLFRMDSVRLIIR